MNLPASLIVFLALFQPPPTVPATFAGVYKGAESGRIVIEVENGQDLRLFVTRATKFIRDGKPSKESQFHDGDNVSVDAERDLRMNLVATRVQTTAPKATKRAAPDQPN